MHRGSRISALLLAGALVASAGSEALAQSNVVAPPPPPSEGTVGPEQLRGFTLGGPKQDEAPAQESEQQAPPVTVTRPEATEQRPAAPASGQSAPVGTASSSPVDVGGAASQPTATASTQGQPGTRRADDSQMSDGLPPATPAPVSPFSFGSSSPPSASGVDTAPLTAAKTGAPLWPWILALLGVIAGGLFLLGRRRAGQARSNGAALAFAGGAPAPAQRHAPEPRPAPAPAPRPTPAPPVAAPRPAPAPAPAPVPTASPAPAHPKGVGIVSTRLRPWLDVDLSIASTVLTDEELQLHLQIIVSNNGSTPARQVGLEVVAMNAGPEQERELATYFGRPDPDPRAADMIAPLDQAVLQTVVRMPRAAFREYSAGGGRVLVPLVALNTSYRAGSSMGRTSAAFLVGRGNSNSEKLGPLRTDQGPRQFNGVIARPMNLKIRR